MGRQTLVKVKRLALKIGSGKTPEGGAEAYVPEGVAFIRSQNVHFDGLRLDDVVFIDPAIDAMMSSTRVKPDDILLNITGASLGRAAIAPATLGSANVNQHVCIIRPSSSVVPRFLLWCLQSRPIQQRIIELQVGGNRDGLNFEQVGDFAVPRPPQCRQQAIADYLDRENARIDALIAAKQHMLRRLAEREPAYVEQSVRRERWPTVSLRRLILRMEQGWSPQCDARLPEGEEWGVLKVGCVNGGRFKPDEVKALPADLAPRARYAVRDGDLLMSRANTTDLVGSVAIASSVRSRTLLSDKLYRIELDETRADPKFVCLWLQTRAVRSTFELDATGASDSMQNIGQDTVRRLVVPLPPKAEQAQIVADCEWQGGWTRSLTARIRRQLDLLIERRQALITAAVTSQIEAPVAA